MSVRPSRRELLLGAAGLGLAACNDHWNPKFPKDRWFNDNHTLCLKPTVDATPNTLADLVGIVKGAEQSHTRVRAAGAGHSFSDVSFMDGTLVETLNLDKPLPLPSTLRPECRQKKLYNVEAGIRIRALNEYLDKAGLALPNMGGWDLQTLAGVISTSTHGSGLTHPAFPSMVRSMVMVRAGGEVVQLEPATDGPTDPSIPNNSKVVVPIPGGTAQATLIREDDAFYAALVSFGCMGIIYSALIELVPAFGLHERRTKTTWEDVIKSGGFLDQVLRNALPPDPGQKVAPEFYELLVNPYAVDGTHMCIITTRTRIAANPKPPLDCQHRPLLVDFAASLQVSNPDILPNVLHAHPESAGEYLAFGMSGTTEDCYDDVSHEVFKAGTINELLAYSVDIEVDVKDTKEAVQRVLDLSRDKLRVRDGVHSGPLSIRFVAASNALLSPQYERDSCMIEIFALDGVLGTRGLLRAHEVDLIDDDKLLARPHWGLDVSVLRGHERLAEIYPKSFERWLAEYKKANATGVFNGEVTDRLRISMPGTVKASRHSAECMPIDDAGT